MTHGGRVTSITCWRRLVRWLLILSLALFPLVNIAATNRQLPVQDSVPGPEPGALRAANPLVFVPNRGQSPAWVRFQANIQAGGIFFTQHGYQLALAVASVRDPASTVPELALLQLDYLGAAYDVSLEGIDQRQAKVSYFLGDDPGRWVANLPTYTGVRYRGLYPGVDLEILGVADQRQSPTGLKATYLLAPGARPERIQWRYPGASRVWVTSSGDLKIELQPQGVGRADRAHQPLVLTERSPKAWQYREGVRTPVEVEFRVIPGGEVGFSLGAYDISQSVTIDPVIEFSTNLGGTQFDEAVAVALTSARNVYLLGNTLSVDFPGAVPLKPELEGSRNVFLAKLARDGVGLEYSVYIGGSEEDVGRDIAVDLTGDIYITGYTTSPDFPVTTPGQRSEAGGNDVFVTKLSVSGGQIRYSFVLGGSDDDRGSAITVDAAGQAFVTGTTSSVDFPTASPLQPLPRGGDSDVFVLKMNSLGNQLIYSTYLGGSFEETSSGIDVDRSGSAYITGVTGSDDFPVFEAYQDEILGFADAFISKLTPDGGGFIYSTFLGVGRSTAANDLYVDRQGGVYVTGSATYGGGPGETGGEGDSTDVFVARLNPDGGGLAFNTRLGGSEDDEGFSVAVDREGTTFITGVTESPDLPVDGSLQAGYGGNGDAFIAQLGTTGEVVTYNYLGGSAFDAGYGIVVDSTGDAVVTGLTFSPDFPTVSRLVSAYGGEGDAFVLRIGDVEFVPTPVPTDLPAPTEIPPTPTPVPTTIDLLVQSDLFLYGLIGLIFLVAILGAMEMNRKGRR